MTQYFVYGEAETGWLKSRDPLLGAAIDEIGPISRPVIPDLFEALIQAIVGQRISIKAQATIWARIQKLAAPISPGRFMDLSLEELSQCGLAPRKAMNIKEIAASILKGDLDLAALDSLKDQEVLKRLCQIKGLGPWTAEMLMTFSMQRPDVLSWGDLAIHRGLRMLYGHRKITPALFAKYKRRYSPHGTVASLYLWAIAGGAAPALKDPKKGAL